MKFGKLTFEPVEDHESLVAQPTWNMVLAEDLSGVLVSEIDADLADTAAFCEEYDVGLDVSANCVIVKAKRAERVWYTALMILATDRADVNKTVKKHLDARKLSFAPMDEAVELTGMEYGGITPIGLPPDWQILIDENVLKCDKVIIGSGIRGSKILIDAKTLLEIPNSSSMAMALPQED